jgi:hypothetical protein
MLTSDIEHNKSQSICRIQKNESCRKCCSLSEGSVSVKDEQWTQEYSTNYPKYSLKETMKISCYYKYK